MTEEEESGRGREGGQRCERKGELSITDAKFKMFQGEKCQLSKLASLRSQARWACLFQQLAGSLWVLSSIACLVDWQTQKPGWSRQTSWVRGGVSENGAGWADAEH